MRLMWGMTVLSLSFGLQTLAGAQQPKDRPPPPDGKAKSSDLVERMMAFDKNKDGKLSKEEITDPRLIRLFDRADANKDGVVTKEELTALAKSMAEEGPPPGGRGGFGPPGGPGGGPPGGPGGRGPGGFGPPPPGQIMPPFLQERLKLSEEQKKQLDALQKEIDGKLGKILTDEQKKQLKEMREGFGRGGPGRRGPGGPPPGEGGDRPRPPQ
jgi:hypothetical protein